MQTILKGLVNYRWLIILNLFLLSPLIHNLNIDDGFSGLNDLVVVWNIVCSLVILLTFQLIFTRPVWFHLLIAPLYLAVVINLLR